MATITSSNSPIESLRLPQSPNLNKWPIFSLLDTEFNNSIKIVSVFGGAGNEALIVTQDDDVYSLGSNCSSCLGLGDMLSGLEPRRVDVLSQKKVIDFAYGTGPHVLAITESGDLFTWGHNGYSQLGHSGTTQPVLPTRVSGLTGIKVIQIACGSHHSLALNIDGEVYAWGYNNCGQIGSGNSFLFLPFRSVWGLKLFKYQLLSTVVRAVQTFYNTFKGSNQCVTNHPSKTML